MSTNDDDIGGYVHETIRTLPALSLLFLRGVYDKRECFRLALCKVRLWVLG
jgi:hypothetical protein